MYLTVFNFQYICRCLHSIQNTRITPKGNQIPVQQPGKLFDLRIKPGLQLVFYKGRNLLLRARFL